MKTFNLLAMIGFAMLLSSCTSIKLDYYQDTQPTARIEEFFRGPIKGWGLVQDMKGRVVRRFDVTMNGVWSGDTGTLTEDFHYYDGKSQHRVWTIQKQPDGSYTGAAGDIIGIAKGNAKGSAVRWAYQMDLDVKGKTYRVTFDDWMFQMNNGVMINRSYIRKFGFTVAELTLFMQKQ